MKREILFRGKTTSKELPIREFNNIWVEGDLIKNRDKYYIHPHGNGFRVEHELTKLMVCHEVIPETVGQFTTLYNGGGKKIFEGDICLFDGDKYIVQRECWTAGGYWAETGFILKHIGWSDYLSFTDTINDWDNEISVEVIGNVHDNPELLGE